MVGQYREYVEVRLAVIGAHMDAIRLYWQCLLFWLHQIAQAEGIRMQVQRCANIYVLLVHMVYLANATVAQAANINQKKGNLNACVSNIHYIMNSYRYE